MKEDPTGVGRGLSRRRASKNGDLARGVGQVTVNEGWKIEELHTEEGRLDEVFRSITLPDTAKEATK